MMVPESPVLAGFVRYETLMTHPRRPLLRLGIFAAVNTLAKRGLLTADEEAFRRATNVWYNANIPLPTASRPDLYGEAWPDGVAWFKRTAYEPLARVPGYLRILEFHVIPWEARQGHDVGLILYEDEVQVVATQLLGESSN